MRGLLKIDSEDPAFAIIVPVTAGLDAPNARGRIEGTTRHRIFVHGHECPCVYDLQDGPVLYESRLDVVTGRLFATWMGRIPKETRERDEEYWKEEFLHLGPGIKWRGHGVYITVSAKKRQIRHLIFNRFTCMGTIIDEYSKIFSGMEIRTICNNPIDRSLTATELGFSDTMNLLEGEPDKVRIAREIEREQLEAIQAKKDDIAREEEQDDGAKTASSKASALRELTQELPPPPNERAKWAKWMLESKQTGMKENDAMQTYIQAKLGVDRSLMTASTNEVFPLPNEDDGDTASEGAPATTTIDHSIETSCRSTEVKSIRRIKGVRSFEIIRGTSSSKRLKHRTVFQGNNVEPSSPMVVTTTGTTSSSYYNDNMKQDDLATERPSAAKRVDPKTIDEQDVLRRQMVTTLDEMQNAVIKYSIACRSYYRNNLSDGYRVFKEDIDLMVSGEEKSIWRHRDHPSDEEC